MTLNLARIATALVAVFALSALKAPEAAAECRPSKEEHDKWVKEMIEAKHKFLIKELDLTKEQQNAFFADYDKMEAELRRAGETSRDAEQTVEDKGGKATEADYQKASAEFYKFREKEAQIQSRYFQQFKKTLSPKQLYKLRYAERNFRHEIMKKHHNLRKKPQEKKKQPKKAID